MITIYAPNAQDFSTLGLGALAPYECVIEEQAGGMYELTMTHPMDAEGKWLNIGVGCIVKAPAPVRETPLTEEGAEDGPATVTRRIYKASNCARLNLRRDASMANTPLGVYDAGTEVAVLSVEGTWARVIVCASGATGYMHTDYLTYVRDEVETITGDLPGGVIYPVQARGQLFRVVSVERDAAEREVRVTARHIFYDLLGNIVKNEYAPESIVAGTAVAQVFERALNPHGFTAHCNMTEPVTGEYTRRGLVECLLDPDDGVVPQTGARLVRDNYDVWVLRDEARETGVTIRHGKNLLGATLTTDWEELVTRIIPVGQDGDGKPLLLDGTTYIDSPCIDDYPVINAQAVEYDVKIGQEGISNAAQARAKLTELAQADFADNGVDLPTVGLDVDFVALGETEEYKKYADLQAVHLYDTVRVIAKEAGIDAAVRVTGYKWDALGRRYESVTLGEITDLKTTIYSYEIPRGAVKTIKIANGAVGSAQLRDLAVQYAHINTAAVEQLSANSITALKAYITELVAGSVTTDELYAGIAEIAKAQITTANIEQANIDWASIGQLAADVAEISKAHLVDADINWGNIQNLTATVAQLAQAEIEEAVIDGAQITDGTITNAKIANATIDTAKIALGAITTALIDTGAVGTAQIADGSITSAKIVSLNADVITAGTLSVDRLLLKGANGLFVAINATDEGLTAEELSQATYQNAISGTVLVARSVTADKIAAKSITANEIAAGTITAAELAAESVDATKIQAGSITTSHVVAGFGQALDISSNQSIQLVVSNVTTAQNTANSAQSAANAAQSAADAAQSAADDAQDTADANASDLASYISSNNAEIENLQGQIDGAITTWFYEVAPSLNNPPANGWTTTEDKNVHLGDLYYDTITGYCYRWQVQNNQYSWQRITDTDVTKALEDAASAQDTADAKRRVFVAQPVPPYDVGDLWAQGVGGDILRCQVAKTAQQSYAASDWARASKYTDDTAADAAQSAADAAQSTADSNTAAIGGLTTRVTQAETAIIQNAEQIQLRATKTEVQTVATAASNAQSAADAAQSAATGAQGTANAAQSAASAAQTAADNAANAAQTAQGAADAAQSTADAAQSAADSAQEGADFATPLTGAEPPEEAPAAWKLWIDEGQTPSVWRRWRGADVGTEREYTETISGGADSPAALTLDNAQGQIESVAVEAGCRAKQAGDGQRRNLCTNTNQGAVGWGYIRGNNAEFTMSAESMQGVSGMKFTLNEAATGWSVLYYGAENSGSEMQLDALKPSTQYTVSFDAYTTVSNPIINVAIRKLNSSGEMTNRASIDTLSPNTWTHVTATLTTVATFPEVSDQVLYFQVITSPFSLSICNLQLEEGSVATDWTPAPGDYAPITGRESVEIAACGKNLLTNTNQGTVGWTYGNGNNADRTMRAESMQGVSGMKFTLSEAATGWSVLYYGAENSGSEMQLDALKPGTQYTVSFDAYSTVPNPIAYISIRNPNGTGLITNVAFINTLPINTWTHVTATLTTVEALTEIGQQMLYISTSLSPFTISICNLQLEEGSTATEYEPYRSMGGGTVTPTEPLYGLPGAEDTVEVSVDGDVTVTRRTGIKVLTGTENWYTISEWNPGSIAVSDILPDCKPVNDMSEVTTARCSHFPAYTANSVVHVISGDGFAINYGRSLYIRISGCETVDDCKAYLAAQAAAGTPVTIVYELAAPETEALTAISPIAPQPGQLNLFTDADALTATIRGSGWETVNDTNDIRAALADVDSDVAGLIAGMGLLEGTVAQLGEQIITPEGVVSIVAASDGYQALVNMASQSADGLELVRVTVSNLNGRVETLEEGVHVEGSNVGLYSSGSPFRMDIDHTGIGITENGQPTITVRESRADIPRITTQTLILGGFAYRAGENDLYQMIV